MFNKKYKDKIFELEEILKSKNSEIDKIKKQNNLIQKFLDDAKKYESNEQMFYVQETKLVQTKEKIKEAENKLKEIESKIIYSEDFIFSEEVNIFNNPLKYKFIDEYKYRIDENINAQKIMVKHKEACYEPYGQHPLLTGQVMWTQEEDLHDNIMDLMIASFNAYCNEVIQKANETNIRKSRELIKNYFDKINQNMKLLKINLTTNYLDLKFEQLILKVEYEIKKQQEKEEKQRQQEILREQNYITKEIEKAQEKLNKELKHYTNQLEKLKEGEDNSQIVNKIQEIENQIKQNDYRYANQRAGYLYCINCKDMKDDMIKLGVTRRLNPCERIDELSNAGHAFSFDVYTMVFSEDVFDLETRIHKYFDSKRVNKINKHKEFFTATIPEVEKFLIDNGYSPEFNYNPINEPYILSMKGNKNETN